MNDLRNEKRRLQYVYLITKRGNLSCTHMSLYSATHKILDTIYTYVNHTYLILHNTREHIRGGSSKNDQQKNYILLPHSHNWGGNNTIEAWESIKIQKSIQHTRDPLKYFYTQISPILLLSPNQILTRINNYLYRKNTKNYFFPPLYVDITSNQNALS